MDLPQIDQHDKNLYWYNTMKEKLGLHDVCISFELVVSFGDTPFVREQFVVDGKQHCEIREL